MKMRVKVFALFPLFLIFFLLTSISNGPRVSAQQKDSSDQSSSSALNIPGLSNRVTIRRDERGIPYIEAANEADLYLAQGYITASDRLWQMDLLRRTARGELSEIFGRATIEEDKRHRLYGFATIAEAITANASPTARAALNAYASGVNAYIESLNDQTLPLEFRLLDYRPRPWRAADSIIIGKIFAETLSTTWHRDLIEAALADLPEERRAALQLSRSPLDIIVVGNDSHNSKTSNSLPSYASPPAEAGGVEMLDELSRSMETSRRSLERVGLYAEDIAASNNWVVSGKHTATGKPLLANDPHLQLSAPSIWYMAHLSAPGLRVEGVTTPGVPGILLGHNERIAWGCTNLGPDVQDLYMEKFDKENPLRYMTPAGWREAEVRHEEIKVRKSAADKVTDTITYDVTVTRHGPIIFEKDSVRYALRWTALDKESFDLESFYGINRARNWEEFCKALSNYTGATQNFIYADVDGHIGYYGAGRIPLRKTGDGRLPYDGATDAGEWTGFIPFKELPHVYDPPSGIIVTANNRIVGTDYPYHLTHLWSSPYRARRIYNLLTSKEKLTIEDFRRIQGDTYSFADAIFTGEVVKMARPLADSLPEWRSMLTDYDKWDGISSAESPIMPIAASMRTLFQRRIILAALGAERGQIYRGNSIFIDWVITTRPQAWLPKEFDSYEALVLACYREAHERLSERFGPDLALWKWGRLGQIRFPHPLAGHPSAGPKFVIDPLPQWTGGGGPTVNVGPDVSMRLIADTSDWDNSQQGIALGESGDPTNPHWKDQLDDWRAAKPRVFPFSKTAVEKAAKETLVLTPVVVK
jgi:penicillin G amidase